MFTKEQQEVIDNFPIFIPEPVRTNYFRNVFNLKPDPISFLKSDAIKHNFIQKSFSWKDTPEGYDYWRKVSLVYSIGESIIINVVQELQNQKIYVETSPITKNITNKVTEYPIEGVKTCIRPLPGFIVMNDYFLNSLGEIRDDAGIWRSLTSDEQTYFIDSSETKIEKHKIPDITIARGFTEEEVQEFIRDFDKPLLTKPDKTFVKLDEADYDGPTRIFSGKKRKSKFSPTNNIS